nr:hypothetical protein [Halomarina oriensis]
MTPAATDESTAVASASGSRTVRGTVDAVRERLRRAVVGRLGVGEVRLERFGELGGEGLRFLVGQCRAERPQDGVGTLSGGVDRVVAAAPLDVLEQVGLLCDSGERPVVPWSDGFLVCGGDPTTTTPVSVTTRQRFSRRSAQFGA